MTSILTTVALYSLIVLGLLGVGALTRDADGFRQMANGVLMGVWE